MKTNKWEVFGWAPLCKKFTAMAYCKTKKDAVRLLAKWRADGFNHPACVQKRGTR